MDRKRKRFSVSRSKNCRKTSSVKTKRQCPSKASSSITSTSKSFTDKPCRGRPPSISIHNVSNWKKTYIESLGVFYHTENFSIEKLFSFPEKNSDQKIKDLPEVTKLLVELTKSHFTLSLTDFGSNTCKNSWSLGKDLEEVVESNSRLFLSIDEAEKKYSSIISIKENNRVFCKWYSGLKRFLTTDVINILSKMYSEAVMEIDFQWLFMRFTEIFLMDPQIGTICKRTTVIHGEMITCIADGRYVKTKVREGKPQMMVMVEPQVIVMITEVKRHLKQIQNDVGSKSVIDLLSDDVLGQVGGELLLESSYSAFHPGVLGILCAGTKVIFLYSEIPREHLISLQSEGEAVLDDLDNGPRTIYFTKAYDYMVADERNEMIEYLFWLGYLQTSKYYSIN